MKNNSCIDNKTVQKKLNCFNKSFRKYRQKLVHYYGSDMTEQIENHTLDEYKQLLPKTPKFPGKFSIYNSLIFKNVLFVAFYKAMKKYGKEIQEAIKISYEIEEEMYRAVPAVLRWVLIKFVFSRLFLSYMNRCSASVGKHTEGWIIKYKKGDGNSSDWYFECHECGMVKYFHAHDVMELAPYCNFIDYIQSNVFGIGMRNPQNIGQGDSICYEYMKKGRFTEVPENLLEIVNYDIKSRST
jgi:hypothetical protein